MKKKELQAKLVEYAYPSSSTAIEAGYGHTGTWFVGLYETVDAHKRKKIDKCFPGTAEGKELAEAHAESLPQAYNWMHKYHNH